MKEIYLKNNLLRTLLSILVTAIFIFLAVSSFTAELASLFGFNYHHDYDEDEKIHGLTYWLGEDGPQNSSILIAGQLDSYGQWTGPVVITLRDASNTKTGTIVAGFEEGYMNGEYAYQDAGGRTESGNYFMGYRSDAGKGTVDGRSGYDVLDQRYTWWVHYLESFGFSRDYVENFMDTLEIVLDDMVFDPVEFEEYYLDAVDVLSDTPLDSLVQLNARLSYVNGMDLIKRMELRKAVIDHYRSGQSTHSLINQKYPHAKDSLSLYEASEIDFEGFCTALDDSLALIGVLDTEDHFFIDSVDARLFRVLVSMYNSGEDEPSKAALIMPHSSGFNDPVALARMAGGALRPKVYAAAQASPAQIAEIYIYLTLLEFLSGDMIQHAIHEAYMEREGTVVLPRAATRLENVSGPSSVSIEGYIVHDGGGIVNSRGIVWAATNKPTLENQVVSAGSGQGIFSVELENLTEGYPYYARAYATNSAGTVYGNTISFKAVDYTGINVGDGISSFRVYPNPASTKATCRFNLNEAALLELRIYDISGRRTGRINLGQLPVGIHEQSLDLEGMSEGLYTIELWTPEARQSTWKLMVVD